MMASTTMTKKNFWKDGQKQWIVILRRKPILLNLMEKDDVVLVFGGIEVDVRHGGMVLG